VPTPSRDQLARELARRSLSKFVRQAWQVLEPSTPLLWDWPLDTMCDHVQAVVEDWLASRGIYTGPTHRARKKRVKRGLIINVPPGSAKSTIVSVCAPAWIWLHCPQFRGIFASGSESVALRDSMKCRDILESEWYHGFGLSWGMAKDQNAKGLFRNTAGGFRKAMAVGARITGDRGDGIFVDDANDAQTVRSKPERDAVADGWWFPAAQNRLGDLSTGFRINIQQRLHMEDLTGRILERNRAAWDVLVIRQEYEIPQPKDPDYQTPTSLGWVDPRTEPGELFFPARFSREEVENERKNLTPTIYAGQHQQRPVPAEGALFKPDKIQVVDAVPVGTVSCRGWDLAATEGAGAWTAGVKIGRCPDGRYIVMHVARARTEAPREFIKQTAEVDGRDHRFSIPQDPGAAGKIQAKDFIRYFAGFVFEVTPETGDKETRAEPFAVQVNAGNVVMLRGDWSGEYIDELRSFPNGKYKDQVDASSRAFDMAASSADGWFDWIKAQSVPAVSETDGIFQP
jgi:predicted phage terminase large subunit-like protein